MMNGPFFRNYSKRQPSLSVPIQQRSSPKVISVPVHFVSSDQPPSMSKDSAAIKIQKVFRGFAARTSVRKIDSIRNEVSEIERRIGDIQVVDLIRGDAKERLRVNETLMSLLFKLDSIRGVDSGIRDLRKAVTRKAIALQEKVDSIAQPDHQTTQDSSEQVTEISNSVDEIVNLEAVEAADVIGETGPGVNIEILENLMDDNEQMMKLMKQISERNDMQTRMINDLSRRVEQLEKAEKKRKKKANVPLRRRRDKDTFCISV